MRITISKENYLKAIAEAESEGETVIAADPGALAGVSAPAVTMAIRRLKRDGLIRVAADGQISLTAEGREIANRVLNRHHLIERMLTEIFGMEWYKVHDEAEQLEHAVSADFEQKLLDKLGTESPCPHGNSSAWTRPRTAAQRGRIPLDEARPASGCGHQRVRARSQAAGVPDGVGDQAGGHCGSGARRWRDRVARGRPDRARCRGAVVGAIVRGPLH